MTRNYFNSTNTHVVVHLSGMQFFIGHLLRLLALVNKVIKIFL